MEEDSLHVKISAETGSASQNIANTTRELEKLDSTSVSATADMTGLETSLGTIGATAGRFADAVNASVSGITNFQTGIENVSSVLDGVNGKFDVLSTSIQSAYGAFDGAAASVTGLAGASEASAAALSGITAATEGFGSRMDALSDTTHGTTVGMVNLQKELVETLNSIRSFSTSMGTAGQDAEAASRKIKELADNLDKVKNSSSSGQQSILGLAAGFKQLKGLVATLGIGAFIKESNDAYNVQMQNELKLTAHMRQRMNATDEEIQAVKDLASAQQQIGVIGDEIQLAGAQQLTTYARSASTLQTLIPAMNNLIAQNAGYEASVGDATSAADMLGRALNGQYTSLKRMGVTFTEAQENILKYGNEQQKADVLADAINSKVGNMNELLANTPTGKLKQLQNDFGDLQEQLGATWQPLISAVVPIASELMNTLAPPIKAVATGITTIGSALAALDSPALRGIALAAAGIAVVNKLKFALGGTATGLLLLGTLISFVVGRLTENEDAISDVVSDAFTGAAESTDEATSAAEDYEAQLGDVQKAVSRLAGFDTITKLSGSSSGTLASALFNDSDIEGLRDLADAANDVKLNLGDAVMPDIDWSKAWEEVQEIGSDIWTAIFGTDEEQYSALKRLTDKVEKIFGPEFVKTFEDVGHDIYQIINGDESEIYKGWKDLDDKLGTLFGAFYTDTWSPTFQKMGQNIFDLVNQTSTSFSEVGEGLKAMFSGDFENASLHFWKSTAASPLSSDATKAKAQKQVELMEEYGVSNLEELMETDSAAFLDYMKKTYGIEEAEFTPYNPQNISLPDSVDIKGFNWTPDNMKYDPSLYAFAASSGGKASSSVPATSGNSWQYGGMPDVYVTVITDGEEVRATDTIVHNGG